MSPAQEALSALSEVPGLSALSGTSLKYYLPAVLLLLGVCYLLLTRDRPYPGFPVAPQDKNDKRSWTEDGKAILDEGSQEFASCFQVRTGSGYKIIVPNRFVDEVKSHSDLSLATAVAKDLMADYPGFDGLQAALQDETFIQEVVRVKLTQSLGLLTEDLVQETNDAFQEIVGEPEEWETSCLKDDTLDIVARLSARMFLGENLCRNQNWLRISKEYAVDAHKAAHELTKIPALVRPIIYWFLPRCARMRKQVREAKGLIEPEVKQRTAQAQASFQEGRKKISQGADAIGWMIEVAKGQPRDLVAAQLSLITAGVHITSEETSKCILRLCDHPELVQPLRAEMIAVLKEHGWSRTAMYNMRLLDSFLKEVQRIDGFFLATMVRYVKKAVTLSDGTVLPKGARLLVPNDRVHDSSVYTNPERFDLERFSRLRDKPGEGNNHQYVATSADQLGFGHGQHACPGRFLVAAEIKTALCFLLLKYDIRYLPGQSRLPAVKFETQRIMDPSTKIQIRRRTEEIDLLHPKSVV
ncbi:uncharacterized protein LTR77_008288 [Saxophila tyrrhenica]|uniref:Uncharacterized protein n=1 Tax=Saxophila tyrrhenica TaxID=1690608 RepID=A0AAV9P0I3_9PEZI|nr:hypothetical protein LTR77_008288 [Saxophila tyrrhenica]